MRRNYVRRTLCLPSRVDHSLVWILRDCHGIVALLVISGKQPSSELLHTLRFICACVGYLSASVQYLRHLLHNTEALLVFQATFSHVSPSRLTSTTQPLATVPGYHTISTINCSTESYTPPPVDLAPIPHLLLYINFQNFFSFSTACDIPRIEVDAKNR